MLHGDIQSALNRNLLPARIAQALQSALGNADGLEDGRYPLDGDDYFVLQTYEPKEKERVKFEAHREYADLQVVLSGQECMYTACTGTLGEWSAYDKTADIIFSAKQYAHGTVLALHAGQFALLFPEDAHQPGCRCENQEKQTVRKLVLKLKL